MQTHHTTHHRQAEGYQPHPGCQHQLQELQRGRGAVAQRWPQHALVKGVAGAAQQVQAQVAAYGCSICLLAHGLWQAWGVQRRVKLSEGRDWNLGHQMSNMHEQRLPILHPQQQVEA